MRARRADLPREIGEGIRHRRGGHTDRSGLGDRLEVLTPEGRQVAKLKRFSDCRTLQRLPAELAASATRRGSTMGEHVAPPTTASPAISIEPGDRDSSRLRNVHSQQGRDPWLSPTSGIPKAFPTDEIAATAGLFGGAIASGIYSLSAFQRLAVPRPPQRLAHNPGPSPATWSFASSATQHRLAGHCSQHVSRLSSAARARHRSREARRR